MRNISFALTTRQFLDRSKTVTRRVGWAFLKPGDLLCGIKKGQGLKKGEKVNRLGVIRVVGVSREWMSDFRSRPDAAEECKREGFPDMTPEEFYLFFRKSHPEPGLDDLLVTRIEFEYVNELVDFNPFPRHVDCDCMPCRPWKS